MGESVNVFTLKCDSTSAKVVEFFQAVIGEKYTICSAYRAALTEGCCWQMTITPKPNNNTNWQNKKDVKKTGDYLSDASPPFGRLLMVHHYPDTGNMLAWYRATQCQCGNFRIKASTIDRGAHVYCHENDFLPILNDLSGIGSSTVLYVREIDDEDIESITEVTITSQNGTDNLESVIKAFAASMDDDDMLVEANNPGSLNSSGKSTQLSTSASSKSDDLMFESEIKILITAMFNFNFSRRRLRINVMAAEAVHLP